MPTYEDTIGYMCSDDWKDRMKAEYMQLRIRLGKIENILFRGQLDEKDAKMLYCQRNCMTDYQMALRLRMVHAGINVDGIDGLFEEG